MKSDKLIGQYTHKIDTKRRLFIPSDLKITRDWVVTVGMERCLFLFPDTEWEKITKKIKEIPLTKKDSRGFLRVFLSGAKNISSDKQGRILIPENLAKYAELEDKGVIIGMLNRLEIWNPGRWEKYSASKEDQFSDLAENIVDLNI
ncbi:MAG: division/cell wall cluster transcriptional repressor MraZ [Elusimicrobiota bacterium]